MYISKKRKRFDIVNFFPALLGIIAAILIIVIIALCMPKKIKSVSKSSLKALPFDENCNFEIFDNGIAYITDDRLYFLDDRNEIMWGFSGASEDMKIYTCSEKMGLVLGKKLQVVSRSGDLIFSKEFEKNISSVAMGDKLIAVSLSRSDDTIVLNSTGEEIDRIKSNSNCTNIRFGVFSTGSIWVITVENSGYSPKYTLSTYKYDTEKTQTVTFEDDSQMMYDAVFDEKLCYIFGTQKIMVRDCDYTGSVNYDYNVNGYDVLATGSAKNTMHILLNNNGNLKAIGSKGINNLECDEKILYASVANEHYYGFSNYFMYRFDPEKTSFVKYRFPVKIDGFVNGNGFAIILSDNTLYRYDIVD